MEKKDNKGRNNRRCIIFDCNSTSLKNKDLKFFRFPTPDSPDYQKWLTACKDSYYQIRILKKPLICSLHFKPEDIGGRRLNPLAYPKLRLNSSQEFNDYQGRETQIKFLNEVMVEWLLRNRPHRDIYGTLLIEKAREARDIINIPNYVPNRYWLKTFNEQISSPDSRLFGNMKTYGTSLRMEDVVSDMRKLADVNSQEHDKSPSVLQDSIEISDDDDYDEGDSDDGDFGDFGDNYPDISSKLEVSVTVDEDEEFTEPSGKMPKLQSILLDVDEEESAKTQAKERLDSYLQALAYLKPLENFALLQADFRAIGLLTQLEALFKKQLE